jgi:predicted phosphodiesterase
MTNFALISDLHCDRWAFGPSFPDCSADYLLIAGDLCEAGSFNKELFGNLTEQFKHIVWVLGNHAWYSGTDAMAHAKQLAASLPNVTVLDGETIELDGIAISGHTLWHKPVHGLQINDCHYISDYGRFIAEQYHIAQAWLESLEKIKPDIVLTHHLPSYACVAEQYTGSPYNEYFVHEGALEMAPLSAKHWCFGHTHSPTKLAMENILLLANPYGYSHERRGKIYKPLIFEA